MYFTVYNQRGSVGQSQRRRKTPGKTRGWLPVRKSQLSDYDDSASALLLDGYGGGSIMALWKIQDLSKRDYGIEVAVCLDNRSQMPVVHQRRAN